MFYNHIIQNLSEPQRKICLHDQGFALVLAGPGSGKTTVTVSRICVLAAKYKKPERILCQTFTVASAGEMKARYEKYIKASGLEKCFTEKPFFSTIHSFCFHVIEKYSNNEKNVVLDEMATVKIIKNLYAVINNREADEALCNRIISAISATRNHKSIIASQIKNFDKIYAEYDKMKKENNYIDFDDMIFITYDLLANSPYVRDKIRKQYDYILLDEAQDMTKIQFDIIRQISGNNNIFVVADDDQSIYGFRGANPTELMNFAQLYNGQTYYLEQNYRSQKNIVNFSKKIIEINKNRYAKNLFTENLSEDNIEILSFSQNYLQAHYICSRIKKFEGSTAILYRNNISSLIIKAVLVQSGISYVLNAQGIRAFSIPLIKEYVDNVRLSEQKAGLFVPSPHRVLRKMIDCGFAKHANEYCEITGQMKHFMHQIMNFLWYISSNTDSYISLVRLLDKIDMPCKDGESGQVVLSTIHSSKGLEYDNVFIVEMINHEFPGQNADSECSIEEERRLFYVAVTRAKHRLTLCYPERGYLSEEEPSVFIEESRKALRIIEKESRG